MRDLNECKVEIVRRSVERIARRRQNRKRILTGCAALMLCIALCGTAAFSDVLRGSKEIAPQTASQSSGADAAPSESEKFAGSDVRLFTAMEVCILMPDEGDAAETSQKIDDQSTIISVYNLIQDFCRTGIIPNEQVQNGMETYDSQMQSEKSQAGCRIVFSRTDGETETYILTENELTDTAAGKTIFLTEEQVLELNKVLTFEEE